MHATVTEPGTLRITLELFVALNLTFSLTTATLLPHHLTTLPITQNKHSRF